MNLAMKHAIILFAAVFFLSACGSISWMASKKSLVSEELHEAANLLLSLKNKNSKLKTFKGAGKVTFWGKGKKGLISNIAWVGSEPDKIRFAMRSLSGQPVVSLACDGTWLYFVSHTEQRFYKKPSKNFTLKKFISIPIKSRDIVSILAGQIPVAEHDFAMIKENRSKDGYLLILKKDWGNVVEKIYLDETRTTVRKLEMFDLNGLLLYQAEFIRMQNINGYLVPSQLFFSGANGDSFQLNINRYWADVSISPSVFVLTPQKGLGD
ncbi:MAG: DUF4292 domain-containing protein [Desulfobacterales bacterium]|nr:DUF4292 domain-containing protein [Desulfobacterales bacterium]